MFLPIYLAN